MADKFVKDTSLGGSDGGSGDTLRNAYETIPYALEVMAPNDTLYAKGIFSVDNRTFAHLKNGTGSQHTSIIAMDYLSTTLKCGMAGQNIVQFPARTRQVALKGFVLDGNKNTSGYGIKGSADGENFDNESLYLLFEDLLIDRAGASGVKPHASHGIWRRIVARQCGSPDTISGHGFYFGARDSHHLVEDCEADGCSNVGFRNLANEGPGANHNTIRRFRSRRNNMGLYLTNTYLAEHIIAEYNGGAGIYLTNGKGDADPERGELYYARVLNNGQNHTTISAGLVVTGWGAVRIVQHCLTMGQANGAGNFRDTCTATRKTITDIRETEMDIRESEDVAGVLTVSGEAI